MRSFSILLVLLPFLSCRPSLPESVDLAMVSIPDVVDYNFHIKPLLSDRCYACHGPDEETRKGGLRLDIPDGAKKVLESGHRAIVPGSLGKSSLVERILEEEDELMMPPPTTKTSLTPHEKALLVKWIDQGANFEKHWAFIKPEKPEVPALDGDSYHPIDAFVRSKLKEQGMSPAPMADPQRLIRRVHMDLTGLPPDLETIAEFEASPSIEHYEKIVDSLLRSEACAERLAMEWMDVARYADSHGLHADGWRNMWPWRDWVIEAFRENIPYDEFVTLQLAGDLLPNPTKDQIIATAFHRNHPMTAEGGAIDEEFRLEYVADRTNTTATAFMGMTMECAKCHDHKFDPISTKEYYQLSAFFNNQRELGMTGDDGNYGPLIPLMDDVTKAHIDSLKVLLAELDSEMNDKIAALAEEKYEVTQQSVKPGGSTFYVAFDSYRSKGDDSYVFDRNPKVTTRGEPVVVEGKKGKAIELGKGYDEVSLAEPATIDVEIPMSASLWIKPKPKKSDNTQVLIGNAGNKNNFWRGWDFYLDTSFHLNLRLINALPHNYLHVRSSDPVTIGQWQQVGFTYDGSGTAQGGTIFINGQKVGVSIKYDRLTRNIRPIVSASHKPENRPLRIGKSFRAFTGDNGIYHGAVDEVYVYDRRLSSLEMAYLGGVEKTNFTEEDYLDHQITKSKKIGELRDQRAQFLKEIIKIQDTLDELMVMEEMSTPRPTHILNRGQYNSPGEEVQPATPAAILSFPDTLETNRLGLAKWLFHPDHPLTARATVNRYWQMIFGTGIVKTVNDFGNQGMLPSHPDLLDWLAVDFQENEWDIKYLLKQMVMSATYRQTSKGSAEDLKKDPENIYLSRSPSYRWPAEFIRDNALAASGLLVQKTGGPSVRPYQPDGLWIEKGTFSYILLRYNQGNGEDLYRRSLYTFIKRTSPPPSMTVFDVPSRDVCRLSRETTNTPMQALVLLNDPQYVEAAIAMADRMLESSGDIPQNINTMFRLSTGRDAHKEELELLEKSYEKHLQHFQSVPMAADSLLTTGEYQTRVKNRDHEIAAMSMVASTILNHDETYTKR